MSINDDDPILTRIILSSNIQTSTCWGIIDKKPQDIVTINPDLPFSFNECNSIMITIMCTTDNTILDSTIIDITNKGHSWYSDVTGTYSVHITNSSPGKPSTKDDKVCLTQVRIELDRIPAYTKYYQDVQTAMTCFHQSLMNARQERNIIVKASKIFSDTLFHANLNYHRFYNLLLEMCGRQNSIKTQQHSQANQHRFDHIIGHQYCIKLSTKILYQMTGLFAESKHTFMRLRMKPYDNGTQLSLEGQKRIEKQLTIDLERLATLFNVNLNDNLGNTLLGDTFDNNPDSYCGAWYCEQIDAHEH